MEPASVAEVQRAVAAAVTPAFLLAGVGALLNVLSQRRNRVVDRLHAEHAERQEAGRLAHLRLRARLALVAMQACILASVLVCAPVAVAFLGALQDWPLGLVVTLLTLGAMGLLALGLLCFLAEATLARTDLPP
ncbi:MAG: DUF2721 domain-containing protein [Roseococcus sp.]|nr:DUF2721 domain-containing protein [Roseococcus sp.]